MNERVLVSIQIHTAVFIILILVFIPAVPVRLLFSGERRGFEIIVPDLLKI